MKPEAKKMNETFNERYTFVAKNCQQVHRIHAEIVVMMQLDTCINS